MPFSPRAPAGAAEATASAQRQELPLLQLGAVPEDQLAPAAPRTAAEHTTADAAMNAQPADAQPSRHAQHGNISHSKPPAAVAATTAAMQWTSNPLARASAPSNGTKQAEEAATSNAALLRGRNLAEFSPPGFATPVGKQASAFTGTAQQEQRNFSPNFPALTPSLPAAPSVDTAKPPKASQETAKQAAASSFGRAVPPQSQVSAEPAGTAQLQAKGARIPFLTPQVPAAIAGNLTEQTDTSAGAGAAHGHMQSGAATTQAKQWLASAQALATLAQKDAAANAAPSADAAARGSASSVAASLAESRESLAIARCAAAQVQALAGNKAVLPAEVTTVLPSAKAQAQKSAAVNAAPPPGTAALQIREQALTGSTAAIASPAHATSAGAKAHACLVSTAPVSQPQAATAVSKSAAAELPAYAASADAKAQASVAAPAAVSTAPVSQSQAAREVSQTTAAGQQQLPAQRASSGGAKPLEKPAAVQAVTVASSTGAPVSTSGSQSGTTDSESAQVASDRIPALLKKYGKRKWDEPAPSVAAAQRQKLTGLPTSAPQGVASAGLQTTAPQQPMSAAQGQHPAALPLPTAPPVQTSHAASKPQMPDKVVHAQVRL